jgi:hypothetical protein
MKFIYANPPMVLSMQSKIKKIPILNEGRVADGHTGRKQNVSPRET